MLLNHTDLVHESGSSQPNFDVMAWLTHLFTVNRKDTTHDTHHSELPI
jgi:hypothetical protein